MADLRVKLVNKEGTDTLLPETDASAIQGVLPIAHGGTGADDASTARTNLDIYSKEEVDSKITSVEGDITSLESRVGTAESNITTNTNNISTNTSNISSLQTSVNSLISRVETDEQNISNNTTNITTNTNNITTNTNDIATIKGDYVKEEDLDEYAKLDEDNTFTGANQTVSSSGTSTRTAWEAKNEKHDIFFGIGATGHNRGIYDDDLKEWLINYNSNDDILIGETSFPSGYALSKFNNDLYEIVDEDKMVSAIESICMDIFGM